MAGPFKMSGYTYPGTSPTKRKKQVLDDGTVIITDRYGKVKKVKSSDGSTTRYKKGDRPSEIFTDGGQQLY